MCDGNSEQSVPAVPKVPKRALPRWTESSLLTGCFASQLGDDITFFALPLIAIITLHASSVGVSLLRLAEYLPGLAALQLGALVGRWSPRRALLAADIVRAAALLAVPLCAILHVLGIVTVICVAVVLGTGSILFDVALQSSLPEVTDSLGSLNARLGVVGAVAQLGGPSLASVAIALLTAPFALLSDAASFLISALTLAPLRRHLATLEAGTTPNVNSRAGSDEPAGRWNVLQQLWRNQLLRQGTLTSALSTLSIALSETLLLLYMFDNLHESFFQLGVVFTVGNTAGLAASLVMTKTVNRLSLFAQMRGGVTAMAVGILCVPLANRSDGLILLSVSQALLSIGAAVWNISWRTLRQRQLQGHALRSLLALGSLATRTSMCLGIVAAGVLGDTLGVRAALWAALVPITVGTASIALARSGTQGRPKQTD